MSRPTTRLGRFLWYRARFTARGERRPRGNVRWYLDDGTAGGFGQRWKYSPRPITSRDAYHVEDVMPARPGIWLPAGSGFDLNGPPFESWPHVTATEPGYLAERAEGVHRRFTTFAYHLRKVKGLARRAGRMNGQTRRVWAATFYARRQGFYPMWDVLERRPHEVDVLENDLPGLPLWAEAPDGWRGPPYAAAMPG